MNRGFWVALGVGLGAYGTVRTKRIVESFTPDGLRDRAAGWAHGADLLRADIRKAMTEREGELRERLGVSPPALETAPRAESTDRQIGAAAPEPARHRKRELT